MLDDPPRADPDSPLGERDDRESSDESGCTLVELVPGYPGFAGYVTGLDGPGDVACLEDIEAQSPGFSKAEEDEENLRAARRLSIRGEPQEWTWENWLGIEAERGLRLTVYSYALSEAGGRRPPTVDINPNDPRLRLGTLESTQLVAEFAQTYDLEPGRGWTDFDFRAFGALASGVDYPNAPDTIDSAFAFFQEWYVSGQGINNEFFWDKGMRQGGWFPVHPDAAPDDQVFAVRGFLYAMRLIYPVQSIEMLGAMAEQAIEYWLTSTYRDEDARSLAEYLVDIKAFDWA